MVAVKRLQMHSAKGGGKAWKSLKVSCHRCMQAYCATDEHTYAVLQHDNS
jgi:hypothetical protein